MFHHQIENFRQKATHGVRVESGEHQVLPRTAGRNANGHSLPERHRHCLNAYSAIPLLESYSEEIIMDMGEILTIALFIKMFLIDESWKLHICPSKENWLSKL